MTFAIVVVNASIVKLGEERGRATKLVVQNETREEGKFFIGAELIYHFICKKL